MEKSIYRFALLLGLILLGAIFMSIIIAYLVLYLLARQDIFLVIYFLAAIVILSVVMFLFRSRRKSQREQEMRPPLT